MTKAADTSTTQKDPDRASDRAKHLFVISILDLSWRLMVVFLLPTFLGVFLDNRYDTDPKMTLVGMGIGVVGSGLIVRGIVKKLSVGEDK